MAGRKQARAGQCLGELTRLSNKLRVLDKQAMDFGTGELLHTFEIHTIDAIGNGDGRSVTELAQWFYVTKGAVSQVVGKLARAGYVTKERNPENGQELRLSLTRKGEIALAGHERFHRTMDAEILRELQDVPLATFETFHELLVRVGAHLDRYLAIRGQKGEEV
jgi:DNA-binding MarR family transcriptional regulator